jgi:archaeosortase A (PGF-CTERM-specific)
MVGPLTDAFAWAVVLLFLAGVALSRRNREGGRLLSTGAWAAFAAFWVVLFPHFAFVKKSYIEGVLALAAIPACLYAGYLLYQGRDSLFVLSRSVGIMGLVYLPFETIPSVTFAGVTLPAPRKILIETVADQTAYMMSLLGYTPPMIPGPEYGYMNTFREVTAGGHTLEFSIVLACTGLGSMAIFAGLIGAVRAPLGRKLKALAVAIPVIYALNLLRTTFIGVVFMQQLMQWNVDLVLLAFGASDPYAVSWFLADRVISQLLAVVALVGITYVVVRDLPELLTVVEDVLFMVTGDEHDLAEQLGLQRPDARADGGIETDDE